MYSADMFRLSRTPISCASRCITPRSKASTASTTATKASQIQSGMPSHGDDNRSMKVSEWSGGKRA